MRQSNSDIYIFRKYADRQKTACKNCPLLHLTGHFGSSSYTTGHVLDIRKGMCQYTFILYYSVPLVMCMWWKAATKDCFHYPWKCHLFSLLISVRTIWKMPVIISHSPSLCLHVWQRKASNCKLLEASTSKCLSFYMVKLIYFYQLID